MPALLAIAEEIPWLVPGVVVSTVLGLIVAARVGRAFGASGLVGFLAVASTGLIVSATLTPGAGEVGSPGACDLSRLGLAPLGELRRVTETSLNVALFAPLGALAALVPDRRHQLWVGLGAAFLPLAIEGVQLLLPALGRGCQSADVIDNLTGTVLGFSAVAIARFATRGSGRRPITRSDAPEGGDPSPEAPPG